MNIITWVDAWAARWALPDLMHHAASGWLADFQGGSRVCCFFHSTVKHLAAFYIYMLAGTLERLRILNLNGPRRAGNASLRAWLPLFCGHFYGRLDHAEWLSSAVSCLLFICQFCVSGIKICLLPLLCLHYAILSVGSGAHAPDAWEFASAIASEKVIKTVIKLAGVGSIKSQSK